MDIQMANVNKNNILKVPKHALENGVLSAKYTQFQAFFLPILDSSAETIYLMAPNQPFVIFFS